MLDDFERWWKIYARKEGKGQARRAYAGARAKASAEVLEAGARRYAAARVGEEPRYTRLPATWLNGESWLDEGAGPTGEGASLTGDQQATVRSRIAALTATGMDQAGIKALRPWELTAEAESRVREAMEQRKNAHVACST